MAGTMTVERERHERIDEYVLRDAWSTVIYKLAGELGVNGKTDVFSAEDLFRELWPTPEDDDGDYPSGDPEFEMASTRTIALEAAILAGLATGDARDYLVREAARLAKLAADRVGGV